MSTETQKVDVLENIKDAIKRTSPTTHFNERANLWATHDAVAELIEAAKDNLLCNSMSNEIEKRAYFRLFDILARVGGAA